VSGPFLESLRDLVEPPLWQLTALAVGLVVGSFANVCIHRIPSGLSIVTPRSRCPRCQAPIEKYDNVPVLSWILLRGRCRHCRAPISIRYPAVEALNGAMYAAIAANQPASLYAVLLMAFVTALLVLALIDLEHQILPNVITLPGVAIGIAASFMPGWPISWRESAAAAVGGYLVMMAFATAARAYYGEEAVGQGDWKLVAMMGAFLGWRLLLLTVFLGAVLGSAVGLLLIAARRGTGRTKVPFGTFLAAGAVLAVFLGQPLIAWYQELL
jgi:leader peptidase (prepilin peptidase) / N-methyltransferase